MAIALLVGIVFVEQGQRRIPVQFAKRVVGKRMYGGQSTYIPLKVNQSGVIPIIFASSVLYLPTLVATALPSTGFWGSIQEWVDGNLVDPTSPVYLAFFGLMIVGFAYFYTAISFDPAKQADTIRKQGGFIPGIRPGPSDRALPGPHPVSHHLPGRDVHRRRGPRAVDPDRGHDRHRLLVGCRGGAGGFAFGGISLLIATGVALETMKQIDSQLMMRNYEGFLK